MTQDLRVPASCHASFAGRRAIRAAGDGWIQWLLTAAESSDVSSEHLVVDRFDRRRHRGDDVAHSRDTDSSLRKNDRDSTARHGDRLQHVHDADVPRTVVVGDRVVPDGCRRPCISAPSDVAPRLRRRRGDSAALEHVSCVDTVLTVQQTAALFFVLAFGMILRWRTHMFLEYRALIRKGSAQ